jgi:hypothetical protein
VEIHIHKVQVAAVELVAVAVEHGTTSGVQQHLTTTSEEVVVVDHGKWESHGMDQQILTA